MAPETLVAVPGGHSGQLRLPSEGAYEPGEHREQEAAPAEEDFDPGAQSTHEFAPVEEAKVPTYGVQISDQVK